MFDSPPPNLPVDPSDPATPPITVPPIVPPGQPPAQPSASSPKPLSMSSRKEPEDIFSDLDSAKQPKSAPPMMETTPARQVPWKMIILLGIVLLLVIGVGVGFWLYSSSKTPAPLAQAPQQTPSVPTTVVSQPTQIEQPPVIEQPAPAATPQPVTQPPAGTSIPLPTTSTPETSSPAPSAPVVPTEGHDMDGDKLTDVEEPYYGADPTIVDTNKNGYPDGQDVQNLYSPVVAGQKLSAAPFMTSLSWNGWNLLAPKPWSIVTDPSAPQKMALTTGTAARFVFEVMPMDGASSLDAWLASQQISADKSFKTKGGLDARQTSDSMATYFAFANSVLKVSYDLNGDPTIEYRDSYAMLLNSLLR